jgi:hypothetical protein
MMEEIKSIKRDVDSKRLEALRSLPKEVLESLTKEETRAFLHEEVWPDSLRQKLKDYLVEEE